VSISLGKIGTGRTNSSHLLSRRHRQLQRGATSGVWKSIPVNPDSSTEHRASLVSVSPERTARQLTLGFSSTDGSLNALQPVQSSMDWPTTEENPEQSSSQPEAPGANWW